MKAEAAISSNNFSSNKTLCDTTSCSCNFFGNIPLPYFIFSFVLSFFVSFVVKRLLATSQRCLPLHNNAVASTLLLTGILMFSASCSSIPTHKPITPQVSIANVQPLNLSLSGQKLLFTLKVKNPNAYDLPMKSLSFIASLAGEDIATGSSIGRVIIPAKGEALVDISVVAGLKNIAKQLKSITNASNGNDFNLDYAVKGVLRLSNWPAAIPFNHSGDAAPKIREQLELPDA